MSQSETDQSFCIPGSDLDPFFAHNYAIMKTKGLDSG